MSDVCLFKIDHWWLWCGDVNATPCSVHGYSCLCFKYQAFVVGCCCLVVVVVVGSLLVFLFCLFVVVFLLLLCCCYFSDCLSFRFCFLFVCSFVCLFVFVCF